MSYTEKDWKTGSKQHTFFEYEEQKDGCALTLVGMLAALASFVAIIIHVIA